MDRRAFYCDVDDTLLMHDLSAYRIENQVTISCNERNFTGVPNEKNIKLLIKFYKLGYDVYVWSKTGKTWAQAVVNALLIDEYVTQCLTKPDYYADDRPPSEWLGVKVYRDAITGEER